MWHVWFTCSFMASQQKFVMWSLPDEININQHFDSLRKITFAVYMLGQSFLSICLPTYHSICYAEDHESEAVTVQ